MVELMDTESVFHLVAYLVGLKESEQDALLEFLSVALMVVLKDVYLVDDQVEMMAESKDYDQVVWKEFVWVELTGNGWVEWWACVKVVLLAACQAAMMALTMAESMVEILAVKLAIEQANQLVL